MKRMLVTGSNGLIGSEMVRHFHEFGWEVHGVDNNMRAEFFGPQGDTRWNQQRLVDAIPALPPPRTRYPRSRGGAGTGETAATGRGHPHRRPAEP